MLKDTSIRNAKPQTKPYKLPREQGLFVLVTPKGAKLWRFAYTFEGREKLLSLGIYPAVPLALARERRDEAHKLLATGIDPSEQRQNDRARREVEAANTFRAIATEWLGMRAEVLTDGTLRKAQWMLELVFPSIGDKPITSIQAPDVLAALRKIEQAGKLETLHRVKARVSEVFRYAIATGRATTDPCRDLRGALKPKRRTQHFAALLEARDIAGLMRAIDGYSGTPEVCAALKLAPLLFVRPGELRTAQWHQFDIDGPMPSWRYHVSKVGIDHIVPLCTQSAQTTPFSLRAAAPA